MELSIRISVDREEASIYCRSACHLKKERREKDVEQVKKSTKRQGNRETESLKHGHFQTPTFPQSRALTFASPRSFNPSPTELSTKLIEQLTDVQHA